MNRTVSMLALAVAAGLSAASAYADTSDKKIAFSNNYAGNSWRQAMLTSYGGLGMPLISGARPSH